MSGLSRTPGKRVWVNSPPRVRIPPSPPRCQKTRSGKTARAFFLALSCLGTMLGAHRLARPRSTPHACPVACRHHACRCHEAPRLPAAAVLVGGGRRGGWAVVAWPDAGGRKRLQPRARCACLWL